MGFWARRRQAKESKRAWEAWRQEQVRLRAAPTRPLDRSEEFAKKAIATSEYGRFESPLPMGPISRRQAARILKAREHEAEAQSLAAMAAVAILERGRLGDEFARWDDAESRRIHEDLIADLGKLYPEEPRESLEARLRSFRVLARHLPVEPEDGG